MPEFMITLRSADDPDVVGPARYLVFREELGYEVAVDPQDWVALVTQSVPQAQSDKPNQPPRVGDILFLVHGFNVSHEAAWAFHRKCAAGLADAQWNGLVISYDWPSDGLVFAYLPDRFNARAAANGLVTSAISLLEKQQRQDCGINVHVMAHSMGCFVTQQAVTWAYQDVPTGWKIGQVLFAAADVDYTVFSAGNISAQAFAKYAGRLTAYCNRYDKALLVSNAKRLDLAPRMGRVGLPADAPPMMCEVDCSDLYEKDYPGLEEDLDPATTHCFYFDRPEFWRDAVLTLGGGIDRSVFPTRDAAPDSPLANRFVLRPDGVSDDVYAVALLRSKAGSPA